MAKTETDIEAKTESSLEMALEQVLIRHHIAAFPHGDGAHGVEMGDRGDLSSDLALAAERWFAVTYPDLDQQEPRLAPALTVEHVEDAAPVRVAADRLSRAVDGLLDRVRPLLEQIAQRNRPYREIEQLHAAQVTLERTLRDSPPAPPA